MTKHADEFVNPVKLYYGDKEFTIGSLGLEPTYAYALHRIVKFKRPDGVLNGITFKEMMSIRTIGATKARVITSALAKIGVEVKDVPEIAKPTKLIVVGPAAAECTGCHAIITTNMDASQQLYRFCPMCGKKFRMEE